jgi:hypothetical protein
LDDQKGDIEGDDEKVGIHELPRNRKISFGVFMVASVCGGDKVV